MSTFGPTGLVIDRKEDIKEKLIAKYKAAFGDGIKTDQYSKFGKIFDIESGFAAEQNELLEGVVNAFNPQAAVDVYLSNLVLLNGIERKESRYSTVPLLLGANSAGATVQAGDLVADPVTGEQWAIDTTTVIPPSSTAPVSATAVNEGPIEAPSGTITQIDTPRLGWASVTNTADATIGNNEETNTELRFRRQVAAESKGISRTSGIYTALFNIDSIESVAVFANNTGAPKVYVSEIVPNGFIWSIVKGGNDNDIAKTLFGVMPPTAGYHGTSSATTVNYNDPITGQIYPITFDRVQDKDIYITINLTKNSKYTSDAEMKQAIIDFFAGEFTINGVAQDGFNPGDNIIQNRIFTPVNSIPGHTVESLYIGFTASPTSDDDLTMEKYWQGSVDTGTIVINEV